MQNHDNLPEKPKSAVFRPELVRLPALTPARRVFRRGLKGLLAIVLRLLLRMEISGRERLPEHGPLLIVSNHLGDADALVGLVLAKTPFDLFGKIELYDIPVVGRLMDWYGTIWLHRGQPDRRAVRAALQGLAEGRMVVIAPEGRESISGALEEGTGGAAYLALKANVPILPVALTGTENKHIFSHLKQFRRPRVAAVVGEVFTLPQSSNRREAIESGTEIIMQKLAKLLPSEYQGVYRDGVEQEYGRA
jgi:1-acyl-sn-glycerol-3-phosphate acyltransferase